MNRPEPYHSWQLSSWNKRARMAVSHTNKKKLSAISYQLHMIQDAEQTPSELKATFVEVKAEFNPKAFNNMLRDFV